MSFFQSTFSDPVILTLSFSPVAPLSAEAYHMIDTCEPTICSWSDDGLTFIVKNTSLFETTIIPQFFKHNKFSSFVRQLNFYGFRKVKFSNSLKIDHKLEAQTAKFWRFRHEKFRRGRKDLLTEIKRTPSAAGSSSSTTAPVVPRPVLSSMVQGLSPQVVKLPERSPEEVANLKSEMEAMKRRMASMTKNIDELTDLVKKVSVNEEGDAPSPVVSPGALRAAKLVEPEFGSGNKRKKVEQIKREDVVMDDLPIMPDWNPSSDLVDSLLLGDSMEPPLPDLTTSISLPPLPSASPASSDDTSFVDDLFQAFVDENAIIPGMESLPEPPLETTSLDENPNKPCPNLMKRIEDSLSTIPREMHEMVASRLIDAISDTQPIADSASSLFPSQVCSMATKADRSISVDESTAVHPLVSEETSAERTVAAVDGAPVESAVVPAAASIPLPLAVATLKTILAEYGVSVECSRNPCKDAAAMNEDRFSKSIPVVPMHA
mmetsp:Transcript_11785/g.19184  ORF Transcript_11785/g.19184 Transcript_11785/m.19184 type:complete len:490 (-) Transcript_11785:388-1857(-)